MSFLGILIGLANIGLFGIIFGSNEGKEIGLIILSISIFSLLFYITLGISSFSVLFKSKNPFKKFIIQINKKT